MLGPRTYRTSCLGPIRPLMLKTSSGSGRSATGSGGRLTPICTNSPVTASFFGPSSIISTTDDSSLQALRGTRTCGGFARPNRPKA